MGKVKTEHDKFRMRIEVLYSLYLISHIISDIWVSMNDWFFRQDS